MTLPQRKGGFGLRDPKTIINAARLASLVNVTERALGFGAAKSFIDNELEKAVANYVSALGTVLRPNLEPSRELQKSLTQPLHALAIDSLMQHADEPTRQRLNSLTTPHATAWLSSSALLQLMSQGEFVAGAKRFAITPISAKTAVAKQIRTGCTQSPASALDQYHEATPPCATRWQNCSQWRE